MVDLLEELDLERGERGAMDILGQAVGRAADMAEGLEVMVTQLSTWVTADGEAGSGRMAAWFGSDHLGDGAPHVATEMLLRWNEQSARLAKMALDAGLDERRVLLSQEQGALVAAAVLAALLSPALGLSAEQRDVARVAVAAELRSVSESERAEL